MTDEEIKEYWRTAYCNEKYKKEQLEKENAELKEKLKPENCLKSLAKSGLVKFTCENGNEHEQLTKAKEIIKKLKALYFSPVVTKDDVKRQDEILAEAEQFLKDCDIDNAIQQANKGLDFDKIADEMEQDLKDSEVENEN